MEVTRSAGWLLSSERQRSRMRQPVACAPRADEGNAVRGNGASLFLWLDRATGAAHGRHVEQDQNTQHGDQDDQRIHGTPAFGGAVEEPRSKSLVYWTRPNVIGLAHYVK